MRVATITFGCSQNLGAMLQAYALQGAITALGHDCEIIRYGAFDTRPFETIKGIPDAVSDVVFFGDCLKKVRKLNAFRAQYLRFTPSQYDTTEELRALNDDFDAFVAGSDQIWNVHKGIVEPFFLSFADANRRRIAYAASFGLSALPAEYVDGVTEGLRRFEKISIRESSGVAIAKALTGVEYPQCVDPVFLKPRAEWEALCPARMMDERYIFVYPTQITPALKQTVRAAKAHFGCKVCSLFYFPGVDRVVKDADPLDFLSWVRHAEAVVASSFHATAFAVIFGKVLRVVPHSSTGSRVVDFLRGIGLEGCVVGGELNFDLEDRAASDALLQAQIDRSRAYLQDALS